ncbi:MAG TPA: 30S ribosomal protein S9 [Firmicutes bacterium]|nr:30S ribosomal protein S9 [Bacillota bacterium]
MAQTMTMATGRRKTAVARVRIVPGSGRITVNGKDAKEYFGQDLLVQAIQDVLRVAQSEGRWDVIAKVEGGGTVAQAYAVRHGLARAIQSEVPELRTPLKKAGFLTRDPRMKERRKYGLKKARKAPQYSKR